MDVLTVDKHKVEMAKKYVDISTYKEDEEIIF